MAESPGQPEQWWRSERARRILLAAIAVLFVAGAAASILIQRGGEDGSSQATGVKAPREIRKLIKGMSPAQKADSVVIAGIDSPSAAIRDVGSSSLGGVIVGAEDWPGLAKGKALIAGLRRAGSAGGRIPPLIVARQEGGAYRAYPDLPPAEGQRQIGAAADPERARAWGAATGRGLGGAGFDLNLAPLADVATLDSPLSDRTFSDDPAVVAQMTGAAVAGCRETPLACATPYFPGLGGASADPADGPATVGLDEASLEARDLRPFEAAIKARVPAIVLSLALYAAYDPVTPAALSPTVAQGLLRDRLGFKGVAISDDLTAGAIEAGLGAPAAAVQAVAAGTDLVIVDSPGQAAAARKAIEDAARAGALPPDRLNEAIARTLLLKRSLGLL